MSNNHLSDDQIQSYLDNPESRNREETEHHLSICSICQEALEQYRVLYSDLEMDFTPVFSKSFSKNVIVALSSSDENRWQKFESGFIVAFFLVGIAVSFYFLNPLPHLVNATLTIINYSKELLVKYIPDINGNLPLVAFAIVILFLVQIFDKKLLKPKV